MKKARVALCVTALAFAAALAAGCTTTEQHSMTLVPKEEPTCTQEGHEQYYSCSDCGKYFSDAQGETEVTLEDLSIPALGHDIEEVAAKEATCTEEGNSVYYQCTRCDAIFADAEGTQALETAPTTPALGHDMQIVSRVDPTYDTAGNVAHYHCSRCEKNFEDSYGDTEIDDVVLPKIEKIGTVTLTVTLYENGQEAAADFSEETATLTSKKFADKVLTAAADGNTITVTDAYEDSYSIAIGDYTGSVSFAAGTTAYNVTLQYRFATDTSFGNTNTASVDLSKMNEENHTIIMSEASRNTGTTSYPEAQLTLPENVKNGKNVAVSFTIRLLNNPVTGKNDLTAWARFGVKMADGMGVFCCVMDEAVNPPLQVCPIREAGYNLGIFDGYDATNGKYWTDVTEAVFGDGLRVTTVRMNTSIRLFAYIGDAWVLLGKSTCPEDAETDIRLLIGGHEWEFSQIEFGEMTWNEYKEATPTDYGYLEHFSFDSILLDAEGNALTQEDISIAPTTPHESVTIVAECRKDAKNNAEINGTITLTDAYGNEIEGTITAGTATLSQVYQRRYTVLIVAENGDLYDGSVLIGEETSYKLSGDTRMEYRYVTVTSTIGDVGGSYTLDLSAINNKHHYVIVNNEGPVATNYATKVTYTLSDEIANSKYVVASFWVQYLSASFSGTSRFGVMMADGEGIVVAPFPSSMTTVGGRLHIYEFYQEKPTDIFAGYHPDETYYSAVYTALMSSGRMHIQVVRADTDIYLYAELGGAWYLLGQTTCDTDDKTEISFLVLDESWQIYDPSFNVLTNVPAAEPTADKAGNVAHYTWTDPYTSTVYYFNADGTKTTQDAITIANSAVLPSVTLTINGKKDGATAAVSGSLSGSYGALTVTGNVTDGTVTLTDIRAGTYTLTLGDYDGTVTIAEGTTEYTVTLEYRWATNTSRGSSAIVDLSKMNDANHTISLNEDTANTGKSNYAEAKLNLPEDIANSKNVTVEFTLKMSGSVNAHTRFGVRMAELRGMFVTVNSSVANARLQVCPIEQGNYDGIFGGWDATHDAYTDKVTAALQSADGLQCRVVRDGGTITIYLNIDNTWTAMGSTTCNENAATDIRLCVGGNGSNTWEFSNITYKTNS